MLDLPDLKTKSGISHRYLRPHQGIVDPELTRGVPAEVTSSCGLDVVCHAVESFVSKPYDAREGPRRPTTGRPTRAPTRSPTCGRRRRSSTAGEYLRRAVPTPTTSRRAAHDARRQPGRDRLRLGGRAHPARLRVSDRLAEARVPPPGYPDDHPFVPHGWSVIVTAPAAFRYTYEADPEKHRRAAELIAGEPIPDADENTLPQVLTDLMRDVGAPSGVRELGYDDGDIEALVEGAMKQQRLLVVSPREPSEEDVAAILRDSMENWSPAAASAGSPGRER